MGRLPKSTSKGPRQLLAEALREEYGTPQAAKELAQEMRKRIKEGSSADFKTVLEHLVGNSKDLNEEGDDEILVVIEKANVKTPIEICPHCQKNVTHAPDSTRDAEIKRDKLKESAIEDQAQV